MIDDIYKNIGIEQPDVADLLRDVQEHPKTWDVYKNGNTLGVNQVEQEKTAVKCQRYLPKNISELSYFVAAVRPGFVTMLDRFLNRENFKYGIPILDELLSNKDVKGSYLAFQEQIMVILQRGGLTGSESYKVIKAISKKKEEIIRSYYEKFSKGFVEYLLSTGSDEESAKHATDECWKVILDSAQYLFNGCLSKNTHIYGSPLTIEAMYKIRNDKSYAESIGQKSLHEFYQKYGYGYAPSMDKNGRFYFNEIVDIRWVGYRPIYLIITESEARVECTSNHKFPVKGHDEMVTAEQLCVGDVLYLYNSMSDPAIEDPIKHIYPGGAQEVYDVEMADPDHNLVVNDMLVVGNSHAVAMALDSLYVAYPKMYWPIETYTALLNIYNDRGDKDKIERCKNEMLDVAGIKCVPCQFRKDNQKFTYDKEKNVIYDVLGSMKGMPKATEQIMSKYADQPFELFTDLLYELFKNGDLKPATIETLIQADYFSEFGKNGKLLQVFYEFTKRKHRISKQLKDTTIETRYVWLRENERMLPDESLDIQSQLLFETSVFGNPKSLKKECRGWYFVTELSEKFPKIITMYRVDTGTVGQMKMAKKTFEKDPLVVGDMFKVVSYNTSPAYRYKKDPATGESIRTVDSTKKDLWLNSFARVAE